MKRYCYYTFTFEPISQDLGTKHQRTFKAIDYGHALKQVDSYVSFKVNGKQVYKAVCCSKIKGGLLK